MNENTKLKLRLELMWWLVTTVVLCGVMYPLVSELGMSYRYLWENSVFIVVLITLARHIFLLKHTFIATHLPTKLVLIFLCIPLVAYLVQTLTNFQTFLDYLDDSGWNEFFGTRPHDQQLRLYRYMRAEMLLFGTGAIITGVLFPFRMVVSIWRYRNRGKA